MHVDGLGKLDPTIKSCYSLKRTSNVLENSPLVLKTVTKSIRLSIVALCSPAFWFLFHSTWPCSARRRLSHLHVFGMSLCNLLVRAVGPKIITFVKHLLNIWHVLIYLRLLCRWATYFYSNSWAKMRVLWEPLVHPPATEINRFVKHFVLIIQVNEIILLFNYLDKIKL